MYGHVSGGWGLTAQLDDYALACPEFMACRPAAQDGDDNTLHHRAPDQRSHPFLAGVFRKENASALAKARPLTDWTCRGVSLPASEIPLLGRRQEGLGHQEDFLLTHIGCWNVHLARAQYFSWTALST